MDLDILKQTAARRAVELVEDGMVVGLGTGSTAAFAVSVLAERVRLGLRVVGIPTSERTARQAEAEGIVLGTLAEQSRVDLTIDGADEVALGELALIKGLGGALLREKIVAAASERLIIIVDATKLVEQLGSHGPLPVEVAPFGWQATARALERLGAEVNLRAQHGQAFLTDGGHYILDCRFGPIARPAELEAAIDRIPGVVESGLFVGMASAVIVADEGGIEVLTPSAAP
ncbi:ribose-5-phosphate isomerase RpiA [Gloeobacter violaceus]|uniref:Ribose-5-phosphate isomerase A n=1 Tax=Gloeobacter violaceus (strain ATCC 29082 / PCC 7421) TaxID=251221 RepID=RPIA_GLOVI|nr:ribose-5-phosphate isomerase RpiA [Gloeobacter violaceus]Q7NPM5.1 RecName: Full=Ribose-5-phosphate isomerase A; AltName: Full=Phosphoriboisomerase A; Short=PRI [Gloeobacter violaceus PCC 7421]BAC87971.1 ribose 5-phosphate isomerase [Gloeobacter violaceus PCC 7421]